MTTGDYLVGLIAFTSTWGAPLATAALVVSRQLPRLGGAPRALAFALVALGALIFEHLLPGLFGALSRWTPALVGFAVLGIAWRFLPRAAGAAHDDTPAAARETGPVSWTLAVIGLTLLVVAWVAQLWAVSAVPAFDVDTLAFQLPEIGNWMDSGSIWGLHQFIPLQAHTNYPHNGDLVYLAAIEPFRSDFLVRLVGAPFVALAGVSAYAIGRELRAARSTAILMGVLFAALPTVAQPGYLGEKPDAIMLAAFGTGTLFALRHVRLGRRADLVLAGVGLGIAFGTKWYGVPAALIVVLVWLVARRSWRGLLGLGGLIAACGGIWLVRNAVQTGSPAFPVALPGTGSTPRDVVRDCVGFSVAHYAGDSSVLRDYIWPGWKLALGLGGGVLLVGWLVALWRVRRAPVAVRCGLAISGLLALAYLVTPYTALGIDGMPVVVAGNVRYLAPALLVAVAVAAWAFGELGRLRVVAEVVALIAVGDGVRRSFDAPPKYVVGALVAIAFVAVFAYSTYLVRRRRPMLIGTALLVVLVVASAGHNRLTRFDENRYTTGVDPVVGFFAHEQGGAQRVAIAGLASTNSLSPTWPAFGPSLDNHVSYLGHYVDGQLREYDSPAAWRAALSRGRYDLLVVGRGGYPPGCRLPGSESDDDAFARAAGFPVVARGPGATLYRVTP